MKDPTELAFVEEGPNFQGTDVRGVSRPVGQCATPKHQDIFTQLAPGIYSPVEPSQERIHQLNVVTALIQASTCKTFTDDLEALFALLNSFLGNDAVEHGMRVGVMVTEMIMVLGVSQEHARMFGLAASLHDIGKLGVSEPYKPSKLSEEATAVVRCHPLVGASILEQSALHFFGVATLIAKYHHEHWNGSGYPTGLQREAIPVLARITSLCNVYDYLLHARPHQEAWSQQQVIRTIKELSGSEFEPALVEIFLCIVGGDQDANPKVYN